MSPQFSSIAWVALSVAFASAQNACAGYAVETYDLNQSNTFADGVIYGTVKIETNDSLTTINSLAAGAAKLTINIFGVPAYGTLNNFGMQKFGFNSVATLTEAQITLDPDLDWIFKSSGTGFGEFGTFGYVEKGTGSSRIESLVITISGLGASATLSNFEQGTSSEYFAAHVAGFSARPGSHYVGGSESYETHHAPVPATFLLMLSGSLPLLCLTIWRRRQILARSVITIEP